MELTETFVKEDPQSADLSDPGLVDLLTYWVGLRRDRQLPLASDLDPLQLKFILGWLMLIDPVDRGGDFRYRLYGSSIADVIGRDLTGCLVSDSFPAFARFASDVYRRSMILQRPIMTRHSPPPRIPVVAWERLILPLAPDAPSSDIRFLVGARPLSVRRETTNERLPWPLS
jgi:hypothetical protein